MTALAIAASVRNGEHSARSVVEEHLARHRRARGELHAFNLVLADEARLAADEIDRRSPPARTPARWPACRSR